MPHSTHPGAEVTGPALRGRRRRDALRVLQPALAMVVLAVLVGCAGGGRPSGTFVAASVSPVGALVRMLAGPEIQVEVFLPPNRNAHDFEPAPGDAVRLAGARLVVTVDPRFDPWMTRSARAVAGSDVPVVVMNPRGGAGIDPHVWLDPPTVIAFVPVLAESLAAAFPEQAGAIRARTQDVVRRLAEADAAVRTRLEPVADTPFALQLPAFVNFTRRYGLRLTEVIQICPEEEPTPGSFARAATELRVSGGGVVFAHEGVSSAAADALALEVGGTVAMLDPFGAAGGDLAALWIDNADRMAEALSRAGD